MTKDELALEVIERLKKEYPDAGCTLDYDQAWKLLVSVRLAAQCTDARVNVVVEELYAKYPDVNALAQADAADIERIVKPCGLGKSKARDISACMKILKEEYGGGIPRDFDSLLKLPGVGRKSANLIMGDVFGEPAIVTDTHCIRLTNRIGLVDGIKDPKKVEMALWKIIPPEEGSDFCHRLVYHGRDVCTARTKPYCDKCCLSDICAKNGVEERDALLGIVQSAECFDIAQICESGQCFRMKREDNGTYSVIAGNRYLEIMQRGQDCIFYCNASEFEGYWKHYFDLETDYAAYREKINPKDVYLREAAKFGHGIRILHQDLWEMIVSFLISQQNNIVRIRRCIQNICEKYGERKVSAGGAVYYTFPTAKSLAGLGEDELKDCNLGYRSKYVVRTARSIVDGRVSLDGIRTMSYKKAKEELLKLFGVGEKVADCICLFALHHMQAFPVDTHIKQALERHYPKGFPKRRYKGCEGVMQQYIFYYELLGKGQDRKK